MAGDFKGDSIVRPKGEVPSPDSAAPPETELRRRVVEILDENHLMSVATNRSDGWPQVTLVNYLREGRALCFVVARDSQKFANIVRDPRVSLAIGGGSARGLSMSARVHEVVEPHRIEQINKVIWARAQAKAFSPHPLSPAVAVLQADPEIVALTDYAVPPGRRDLMRIVEDWRVEKI